MDHTRRAALSFVNHPIPFESGQFAGQTVRAELVEVQKADLGRKYARVDRRPLDPPPVVLLRLYYVHGFGTDKEIEEEIEDYDDVQSLGLLCNVDLFPVPSEIPPNEKHPNSSLSPPPPYPVSSIPSHPELSTSTFSSYISPFSSEIIRPSLSIPSGPRVFIPNGNHHTPSRHSPDVIAHYGTYPVAESLKCTSSLVGATFVQPVYVDHSGRRSLMFVFADLAVKIEGFFVLRYRVFDIFSKTYGNGDLPIQAECFGGAFKVYSTKEFPGLRASTKLTKQLARGGVRLNIRETERRRRKVNKKLSTSLNPCPAVDKEIDDGSAADNSRSDNEWSQSQGESQTMTFR
ncbi:hypothetical protein SERLA73DRAFT_179274 [Serpula lacrymans var. lacrymans S7.3]|uniref:Velvet domain-containing protein n=2 Tax=Serpula lacrymans var. lacrymans TaxID=341189 RepID=F8PRT9_SERL3|nr:uncharacterized protein SERLADRAFT_464318 [Serpula lacrymans var. lacrymans S7.9]EGO01174.1 hypothetical protein SERLA73DRAFT_179274 [Serpula lacrymans var. lacrymans S7.3]EGO26823.1 hypothetical protein SERLADRAFT_464318 [Serpula lacrymans var. lacrymans S7.9]